MTNYVKNKNRGRRALAPEDFIPNHEKLNIEPQIQKFDRSDFKSKAQYTRSAVNNQSDNGRVHSVGSNTSQFKGGDSINQLQEEIFSMDLQQLEDDNNIVDADRPISEDYPLEVDEQEELNINSINTGDFVLISNGEVISVGSQEKITQDVEYLVFEKKLDISKFLLFKRINFKLSLKIE